MLLEDLTAVIESRRSTIRNHRQFISENETRTRMALIDPLLKALGWDSSDPSRVAPEYGVEDKKGKRVDYALKDTGGNPVAIMEAKRLGEDLDEHLIQLINYANLSGIKYAGLTDGDRWQLYDVFAPVPIEKKRMLNVSIDSESLHSSALKLLVLWNLNLQDGIPVKAGTPVLNVTEASPTVPQTPIDKTLEPSNTWLSISECRKKATGNKPQSLRIGDGTQHPIQHWNQILPLLARGLFDEGLLHRGNTPLKDQAGSRHIIASEPSHPMGKAFTKKLLVKGTPFYLDLHASARRILADVERLLRHCEKTPDKMRIQLKQ
ncbi:MAG: type I restriction enzyme HsdR N-terminal domain-containing protein [Bryobacterales bacterium]|nr:type I restriction enzyme HsdR N-terminal domain-containing protein [Bryobacterales bacterium]